MSLPPFKRILRKCHSGQQTTVTIPPTNFASFTEISEEPCQSTLSFSDVRHQVIPSRDSFTFNKKSDQLCQKDPPDHPTECQAISMEEEDVPLFRKNLRKALDMEFIAAATKRDRNLQPLINMIRQQKWDQIKACYGPYFYNVRDRLSVRNNVLLYDDRVAIPKQLRQIILDSIHLTHPGQGGMLEAAKHIWYPYLHRDIVTSAQSCKECRAKVKKILKKSALTPEAIWNRDTNSEDKLSVVYKSNYLPEPPCEPAGPSTQAVRSKTPGPAKTSQMEIVKKKQVTLSDTDEDEEFDQALLKKFPIGALEEDGGEIEEEDGGKDDGDGEGEGEGGEVRTRMSVQKTLKSLISESTAHGIASTVSSNSTRSLFWLLVFMVCAALFSKQSFTLVAQYLSFGKTVSVSMVPDPSYQFPKVTLCSHNMVNMPHTNNNNAHNHHTQGNRTNDPLDNSYTKLDFLTNIAAWDIYFHYCKQLLEENAHWTQSMSLTPGLINTFMKCYQPDSEISRFSHTLDFEPIACNHLFTGEAQSSSDDYYSAYFSEYEPYTYDYYSLYRSSFSSYFNISQSEENDILHCIGQNDKAVRLSMSSSVWTESYLTASAEDYSDVIELYRTADLDSIASHGLQLDTFLVECHYKLLPCDHTNFVRQQTDSYGNCFTFTAPRDRFLPPGTFPSYNKGLALTVRIANEENAELLTSSSGIKIAVHDHSVSHGVIEDEGVSASLGTESMIQFSKKVLKRGVEENMECIKEWPSEVGVFKTISYDRKLCRSFCLEHQLVGACNCTLSLLYHHYHPRVSFCQLLLNKDTQYECWKNFRSAQAIARQNQEMSQCEKTCQHGCLETKHDMLLSKFWYPNINSAATEIMRLYLSIRGNSA
ncbi:uncharacterized protein LOC134851304, partial [Symsagittifera roscoffensis]|uniref:uncharacterized protein LOC134851304 n=1 Tax=Symsagittifera roscoffensis TaxID=84072 RepID=UPI00307C3EA8